MELVKVGIIGIGNMGGDHLKCIMGGKIEGMTVTAVCDIDAAKLRRGQLLVIGCSSSEIAGVRIGKGGSLELAQAVLDGIYPELQTRGIQLAVQCCEHLNRALIVERAVAEQRGYEIVNAVPHAHAGGSFATVTYAAMEDPVAVEEIRADAGLDIGGTLIGMHLKHVAVPVRLPDDHLGEAILLCARTRPQYSGGERAKYLAL